MMRSVPQPNAPAGSSMPIRGLQRSNCFDGRTGLTLLELVIASTVLAMTMLAVSALILRANSLRRVAEENQAARNALSSITDQVRAASVTAASSDLGWSAALVAALQDGGDLGNRFAVAGLNPLDGQLTVADVLVVTDETATDGDLGLDLGMPRDLNGDGIADLADVGATARLLPIVLTLRWSGVSGDRELPHGFFVSSY